MRQHPQLKSRVLALLESYDDSDYLDEPPPQIAAVIETTVVENLINKLAGPYRLLEMIGLGGMGIV